MNELESSEKIHELEIQMVAVKKDNELQTRILDKLDQTVDRIQDLAESMHRLVSIHDEKFRTQEKLNDTINNLISERRNEARQESNDIREELRQIEEKILKRLDEFKDDLSQRIEDYKKKHGDENEDKDEKHNFFQIVLDNWKIILFTGTLLIGLITRNWNFFTKIFS